MDFTEKTLTSEYKFEGRIMKARVDTALLPNGKEAYREVCEHVGGVGVLPVDADGNAVLVRQFRYPYGETLLEIPAGKIDHGPEGHLECGVRELREETGYTADRMVYMGEVYPSPGFLTEVLHLYCALGLHGGDCDPDEDEFVETVHMPFSELEKLVADGTVRDGKTIAAVCKARLLGLV
ncbi:NUDIX hydrolase [Intestinibacillus massiliensis]|uniref:NUDIX domain-containing protein n=1 Tax=Intestinibacillus massiliensis TaxID=1871029 RepID=UPI000B36100F|nr:NUDIX hydrolase [Intestinibacillus massiliensis]MCB6365311.1 NUDIX hydrolase [Intestinibacillus massiliensis]